MRILIQSNFKKDNFSLQSRQPDFSLNFFEVGVLSRTYFYEMGDGYSGLPKVNKTVKKNIPAFNVLSRDVLRLPSGQILSAIY